MSIEELMCVARPPKIVVETGNEIQWRTFQERMGMEFPRDWFEFAVRYGSGEFADGIHDLSVLNPFSPGCYRRIEYDCELNRDVASFSSWGQEDEEGVIRYAIHPARPGLFQWGHDSNGYNLYWFTEGEPDEWPIVMTIAREDEAWQWNGMSMTTFLARAMAYEVRLYQPSYVFGHGFRNEHGCSEPSFEADWVTRNGGAAARLARAIFDERAYERMPVLGDALEEAGCNDADILQHCRYDRIHTRGCWVVDSLLKIELKSPSRFEFIQNGMPRQEVLSILGPGEEVSGWMFHKDVMEWVLSDGNRTAIIHVTFDRDGNVSAKEILSE